MIRLLFDEDLNHNIVRGLLRRMPELDATTALLAGLRGRADIDVLRHASEDRRVVVSHDLNTMTAAFRTLQERGEAVHGLVLVPQSLPVGRAIDDLVLICRVTDEPDWLDVMGFLPI